MSEGPTPTTNQQAFDQTVRRKILLLRVAEHEADAVGLLLRRVQQDILDKITGALATGAGRARLESLLESVKRLMGAGFQQVREAVEPDLEKLASQEAAWEIAMLERVVPVQLDLATVRLESLIAASRSPINGITLDGWLNGIEAKAVQGFQQAIVLGNSQGETIPDLVTRIRGTKSAAYQDGIMGATERDAQALIRTAVSHVSNESRELVWQQNPDLILCLRWTSTLDGRTTAICQSRDGKLAPVDGQGPIPEEVDGDRLEPPGARPPAHFNCRSVMVPVVDPNGVIGNRPYVRDTRLRDERESEFRAEARKRGVPIQEVRAEWAKQRVGTVPAKQTYGQWLRAQSAEFQDEVLGPTRGKLFRDGASLDGFVDVTGKRLTLEQLG
jgi:SPP1 gp7 family putative phage head morphogenesis protein